MTLLELFLIRNKKCVNNVFCIISGLIIYFGALFRNFYYTIFISDEYISSDVIGYLFGYPFHWHTVTVLCMNNAMTFLLTQMYHVIRKPTKLVFIPTLIPFKITDRQTKIKK